MLLARSPGLGESAGRKGPSGETRLVPIPRFVFFSGGDLKSQLSGIENGRKFCFWKNPLSVEVLDILMPLGNASRWMSEKGASTCAEVDKEVKSWWRTINEALLKPWMIGCSAAT
jgi:hypothetical protein